MEHILKPGDINPFWQLPFNEENIPLDIAASN